MKILTRPHPNLTQQCSEFVHGEHGPELVKKCHQMAKLMIDHGGAGLAGPQVGWMRRVVVTVSHGGQVIALLNPEIVARYGRKKFQERCLSIPNMQCTTYRPYRITVVGMTPGDFQPLRVQVSSFDSSVWCHEIDHLNGILMTDRATKVRQIKPQRTSREILGLGEIA